MDDVVLPGFRFHPTDEELVGFYLKKKIQQRALPIELIKQVDIYKYDPWDLPNLAPTGEKEWYFYCPRDRKYRNSARPNRVTGAGFWKATGTDRPIYSSNGSNCIGLKKSLVFYRGRAAKGIKTDWMMHEFRLPSLSPSQSQSSPPKKIFDKSLPPNDAWAICRIFKKTSSMAQRALSHSWASSLPESNQLSNYNDTNFTLDTPLYTPIDPTAAKLPSFPSGFMFSTMDISEPNTKPTSGISPIMFNPDPGVFGESQQHFNDFSINSAHDEQVKVRTSEFPFSLPLTVPDDWNVNMPWDSPTNSTNKCYK